MSGNGNIPPEEKFVPPAQAAPGDRLSRPVKDREGSVLLPAGTILDEASLERLAEMGVSGVWIRPDASRIRRAQVEKIFQGKCESPLMNALFQAALSIAGKGNR